MDKHPDGLIRYYCTIIGLQYSKFLMSDGRSTQSGSSLYMITPQQRSWSYHGSCWV